MKPMPSAHSRQNGVSVRGDPAVRFGFRVPEREMAIAGRPDLTRSVHAKYSTLSRQTNPIGPPHPWFLGPRARWAGVLSALVRQTNPICPLEPVRATRANGLTIGKLALAAATRCLARWARQRRIYASAGALGLWLPTR